MFFCPLFYHTNLLLIIVRNLIYKDYLRSVSYFI
nr:MAG TPA: hypothetical protein [Caudoviricetes sp.]